VNAVDRRTTARILNVNHAGEYGAIRIYGAQVWVAQKLPDVIGFRRETLEHEIQHCSLFLNAMRERSAKPCRVMSLWGNGGLVLGFLTALLRRQGICRRRQAYRRPLLYLRGRDDELYSLIHSIQHEELAHLNYAQERVANDVVWARAIRLFISYQAAQTW
jgi:3-demethoxyubiquinol 3-hydroxylase